MIVDARRSNAHFKPPLQVNLCAGESLGSLELGSDEPLVVCQADLKDAFYHLELPAPLRGVFGLPRVRARDVGVDCVDGVKVLGSAWIFPRIAVVPMGWSHALHICQSIHEELAERSGLVESDRVFDRKRAPRSQCTHAHYVDNMVIMGSAGSQVRERFDHAVKELKRAGLQVHEEETSVGDVSVLGWEYSSNGLFRPSRKRAWKARQAARALLQRGRASGSILEKVLGHLTFISLCRREALSVFGEVYNFIKNHRFNRGEVPLPGLVRKELKIWDSVLPLIFKDLRSPWSQKLSAVDASEFGLGMTQTQSDCSIEESQWLGGVNERWRFRLLGSPGLGFRRSCWLRRGTSPPAAFRNNSWGS